MHVIIANNCCSYYYHSKGKICTWKLSFSTGYPDLVNGIFNGLRYTATPNINFQFYIYTRLSETFDPVVKKESIDWKWKVTTFHLISKLYNSIESSFVCTKGTKIFKNIAVTAHEIEDNSNRVVALRRSINIVRIYIM